MPFEEEPALDLLATLANAACLMRSGELRRNLLGDGWIWSGVESLSSEEGVGEGLALLLAFPLKLEGRRCMRQAKKVETGFL
jgi:hypothetical protein